MNIGELCPAGTEIKTEKECSEALNFALDLGITTETSTSKNVTVVTWDKEVQEDKMTSTYLSQPILLNNTIKATSEVLYFNRATKVGSLAFTKLLYVYLHKKNGFKVHFDSHYDGKLSKEEQVLYLNFFSKDNVL